MSILCIYGCGGMGREIADLAHRIKKWKKIVFVDDNIKQKLIDTTEVFTLKEVLKQFNKQHIEFIVATGEPSSRKAIYEKLIEKKIEYISLMDPSFILSPFSSIEKGTIVHIGVVATCNVHIGCGCLINKNSVIGHDVTVGKYCVISPNVTVGGDVNIDSNCYIGSGAIIRNGINIGKNSIIGMGAVVLQDVAPDSVMVGNPAKFLRENIDNKVFKNY